MHQKALIVTAGSTKPSGLDELNIALERGWRVAVVAPMGGAGASKDEPRFAALVIMERSDNSTHAVLHAVEEESGEIAEGDGATKDVAEEFDGEPPRSPEQRTEPDS